MKDEVYLRKLGEKIYALRKEKGLSQEQLAERLDTKHTQIGRLERGETNPTIVTLRRIAKELGVTLNELLNF